VDTPTVTPCGHVFCGAHILEWLKQESTCPVCRRHIVSKQLVTVYDGHDDGKKTTGPKLSEAKESDSVQAMLLTLQAGWDQNVMARAKLRSRVGVLEHENMELKRQLEAALAEITDLQEQHRVNIRQMVSPAKDAPLLGGTKPSTDGKGEDGNSAPSDSAGSKFGENTPRRVTVEGAALYDGQVPRATEDKLLAPFKLMKVYELHHDPVHGVDVHPTRPLVASASWDKTCIIYDLARDCIATKLQGHHKKGLYAAKFSKDYPNLVATVSSDHTCRLWRLDTGKHLAKLQGHEDEVNGMAFYENTLATASDDRRIIIWDIDTHQIIDSLEGHRNSVYGLCYQPPGFSNGGLLASVAFDWMTMVWDPRSSNQSPIRKLEGHRDDIIGVDFSPNGLALATGSDDGTCRVWDCRMWRTAAVLRDHQGECKRVSFSPYGRALATTSGDGTAKIWDMYTFACTDTLEGHEDHVFDAAWGHDGNFIVTGCHDNKWRLWKPCQQ